MIKTGKDKSFIITLFTVFLLLINIVLPAFAQVSAYSVVDKNNLTINDNLTLQIVVTGGTDVKPPVIKNISDFRVMSSSTSQSIQIINGRMTTNNTYIYILNPKRAGKLLIGEANILADNKNIYTGGHTVEVTANSSSNNYYSLIPPSSPQTVSKTDPGFNSTNKALFAKAFISKVHPYENEQIVYTAKLYFNNNSPDISSIDQITAEPPEFKGLIDEKLEEKEPYTEIINSQVYTVKEYSYALFPNRAGKIIIPPTKINATLLTTQNALSRLLSNTTPVPVKYQTNSVLVYVKRLPRQPVRFSNAVGDFKVFTQVNKTRLKTGETAKLKVVLVGKGNLNAIQQPDFSFNKDFIRDFKIYPAVPETVIASKKDYLFGEKIFKFDIVPLKSGKFTIPPLEIITFDPNKGAYQQLRSDKIALTVEQGANTNQITMSVPGNTADDNNSNDVQDLFKQKTGVQVINSRHLTDNNMALFALLFIIPLLILTVSFIYVKKNESFEQNIGQARRKIAYKKANARMEKIKKFVKNNKSREFYCELDNIVKDYIADKFNISSSTLTSSDVENILKEKSITPTIIVYIVEILRLCEMSEYSTDRAVGEKIEITYKDTCKVLKTLDKELNSAIKRS